MPAEKTGKGDGQTLNESLFKDSEDNSLVGAIARQTKHRAAPKAPQESRSDVLAKLILADMKGYGPRAPGWTLRLGQDLEKRLTTFRETTPLDKQTIIHFALDRLLDDLGF